MGQRGLFDTEDTLVELIKMGDPLAKLNQVIDWNIFRSDLNRALAKERKSQAGRPPFDYLMMFKILILQTMYGLSDAQTQYQILDRHTFKRFLGLGDESLIPDEKTIWNFREVLNKQELGPKLFKKFDSYLNQAGYSAKKGQIVDASFVEVPRQRNSHEENETIKKGGTPPEWEKEPAKLRQKDVDARWTQKNGENFYGYKDHVNVDVKHKLIRDFEVTPANVHDSQVLDDLMDADNSRKALWADSAYSSRETDRRLKRRKIVNNVHRRGNRHSPLSMFQQLLNRRKSQIRVRVEHVFGSLECMTGMFIRGIGLSRSKTRIALMNLVYNLRRYAYLANSA